MIKSESTRRVAAGPDVSLDELQLAVRNHSLPLEALRYPVTPIGLHYLLTHFDIPQVDAADWRLGIGGHVRRSSTLTLDDIHPTPSVNVISMESAGGNYKVGPVKLDQSGRWVVRFHFYETCSDIPEDSPHGHVAFYVDVP